MITWKDIIEREKNKDYFKELMEKIKNESLEYVIYPKKENIFKALELTPLENVKVVLLGQDPYHEENQANGLAFSVNEGVVIPPSLRNIYKELNSDLGISIPNHGNLESLALQGVLLLNTVLTVRKGFAQSHHDYGWQEFTDVLIKELNNQDRPIVYILLGRDAKTKKHLINNPNHYIIEAAHPSPLSAYRGFFGSKIFSKTNNYLMNQNINPINFNSLNE